MMIPADDADADGQKRNNDADRDVPEDDRRARLPHKMQHRRHILERAQTVAPGAAGALAGRLRLLPGTCRRVSRNLRLARTSFMA